MSAGNFVHLTGSTPAREHVEALLAKLGRTDRVLELPDEMPNEGPLHDIDTDGPSRAAWRERILGMGAEAPAPDAFPRWLVVVLDRGRRRKRGPLAWPSSRRTHPFHPRVLAPEGRSAPRSRGSFSHEDENVDVRRVPPGVLRQRLARER